jgi:hypothetical protein
MVGVLDIKVWDRRCFGLKCLRRQGPEQLVGIAVQSAISKINLPRLGEVHLSGCHMTCLTVEPQILTWIILQSFKRRLSRRPARHRHPLSIFSTSSPSPFVTLSFTKMKGSLPKHLPRSFVRRLAFMRGHVAKTSSN